MAEPALAREGLCALRGEIARMESADISTLGRMARAHAWDRATHENKGDRLMTGAESFDAALEGGLARAALHEIRTEATADNGAASGMVLALARLALGHGGGGRILWIADPLGARESGRLYGPGLLGHGLPSGTVVHAAPKHLKDALMIAEAALTVASFAAIVLEVYGNPARFGLTESRRLSLRARAHKKPILLLRERGGEEASSAMSRMLVRPVQSSPALLPDGKRYGPGLGQPVFHVTLEKSRTPSPPAFYLEWNADDCLFRELDSARIAVSAGPEPENAGALVAMPVNRPDRAPALGQVMALPRAS